MTEFTTRISSGGIINIPQHTEEMEGFEKDDLLTLEVKKHKKSNGDVVIDNTEAEQEATQS